MEPRPPAFSRRSEASPRRCALSRAGAAGLGETAPKGGRGGAGRPRVSRARRGSGSRAPEGPVLLGVRGGAPGVPSQGTRRFTGGKTTVKVALLGGVCGGIGKAKTSQASGSCPRGDVVIPSAPRGLQSPGTRKPHFYLFLLCSICVPHSSGVLPLVCQLFVALGVVFFP